LSETQTIETPAADYPAGEYAKVEMMGHRTVWGRISEVERFGVKMCQIEPICGGKLLPPILTTGASIYCMTPVAPNTAFGMAPREPRWNDDTLRLLAAPADAIRGEHPIAHKELGPIVVDGPPEFVEWLEKVQAIVGSSLCTHLESELQALRADFDAGVTPEQGAANYDDRIPF
jgi:hypothetical protein